MKIAVALSLLVVTPMPWSADWRYGLPLIVLTLVIHVLGLLFIDEKIARVKNDIVERYGYRVVFVMIIGATAMLIALMHGIEAAIWAAKLMALCDQLEAQLTTTQSESSRLLESALHHCLNDSHYARNEMDKQSIVSVG
jgi:hypothetical protein